MDKIDNIRKNIMGNQHTDITYLQHDDIGGVIAKALASTYETRPKNPIEYFARYLINHKKTEKAAEEVSLKRLFFIIF